MNSLGERLIFVGGLPRSGTTLLQNILDCHPDVLGGPEFDRIPNIADLRRKLLASIETKRIDYYLTRDQVNESIGGLIESLLLPTANRYGKTFLSEKTPWNILVFPDLLETMSRARFIHVIRDPRAAINSMIRVAAKAKERDVRAPDFTTNIYLALYYAESVYKIADICTQMAPARFMTVKFEDLVIDTGKESRNICQFLNLPWDESMLFPGNKQHPGQAQMTTNSIWYDTPMYSRNPDPATLNNWKNQLDKSIAEFIGVVLRNNPYFGRYGYDLFDMDVGTLEQETARNMHVAYRNSFNFNQLPYRVLG